MSDEAAAARDARDTIVCVDDEPLIVALLSRVLARKLGPGYTIEGASNGAEALALIDMLEHEHARLRMVVSDAMMPIMDGYALVEWLHEHRPEVLTIMISGCEHKERIDQLRRESGLLACFSKPWESEEFLAFIAAALGRT
jgi:CheY-like chemotaxis protein